MQGTAMLKPSCSCATVPYFVHARRAPIRVHYSVFEKELVRSSSDGELLIPHKQMQQANRKNAGRRRRSLHARLHSQSKPLSSPHHPARELLPVTAASTSSHVPESANGESWPTSRTAVSEDSLQARTVVDPMAGTVCASRHRQPGTGSMSTTQSALSSMNCQAGLRYPREIASRCGVGRLRRELEPLLSGPLPQTAAGVGSRPLHVAASNRTWPLRYQVVATCATPETAVDFSRSKDSCVHVPCILCCGGRLAGTTGCLGLPLGCLQL